MFIHKDMEMLQCVIIVVVIAIRSSILVESMHVFLTSAPLFLGSQVWVF